MDDRRRVVNHDLYRGDCRDVLAELAPDSFDACVTDPPYELGFMGAAWDRRGVSFDPATWAAVFRVLKPGAHLLAFGGTRTVHRIAVAIEDAGFEIRDQLAWLYGQGFPKSLDVGKAAGAEWDGWGTALKPAFEPIVLARKPFAGTVAGNVIRHGAGALNIAAARIPFAGAEDERESKQKNRHADFASGENVGYHGFESRAAGGNYDAPGRWPANVILDESAAAMLDEQSGASTSTQHDRGDLPDMSGNNYGRSVGSIARRPHAKQGPTYADAGGASRFFYCAKASRAERDFGLEDRPLAPAGSMEDDGYAWPSGRATAGRNGHPTVKPIDLMRWLVRLTVRPGGTIVDPFAGSGSTGVAADAEGVASVLVDLSAEWLDIAERRIVARSPMFATVVRSE